MRHSRKFAVSLFLTTVLYNNCSGFKGSNVGVGNFASNAPGAENFVVGVDPNPTPTPSPLGTPVPRLPNTMPTAPASYPALEPELAKIASNFDTTQWISDDNASGMGQPEYGPYEGVGAFRFICKPSHNLYDDPIVYNGQPGASHLHTFFGNTSANAYSTYQSLRSNGDGTCAGGPLNRSAYWFPSMRVNGGSDATDKIVMPDFAAVYYKMPPENARAMPRGAKIIFGYNMSDPSKSTFFKWVCIDGNHDGKNYPNLTAMANDNCGLNAPNASIEAKLSAPTCWDGRLDSPDHRSHMSEPSYGSWGFGACDPLHPYHFAAFSLSISWRITGPDQLRQWYLSSDHMIPGALPGSTLHSDWFGAWDDDVVAEWMGHADADGRSCSGGDLCDGRGLADPFQKTGLLGYHSLGDPANPQIVDPPVHP